MSESAAIVNLFFLSRLLTNLKVDTLLVAGAEDKPLLKIEATELQR